MTAYIYDTKNIKIINRYDTMRGAKAALTRARKGAGLKYMTSFGYGLTNSLPSTTTLRCAISCLVRW
jgi:hypothetical protein